MASNPRSFSLVRKTNETSINMALSLDGSREIAVNTGFGMLNHMLSLLAFWADFNLLVTCEGDLEVDAHHSTEDVGLCLGVCLNQCLSAKSGINRVGFGRVPMDEALAEATIDLSGRPWLEWRNAEILPPVIAGEEKDLWREFYKSFASAGKFNLHINFLYGKNGHHLLESASKSCGVALKQAVTIIGTGVRSSKGELD